MNRYLFGPSEFPNLIWDDSRLHQEISSDPEITTALQGVGTEEGQCVVDFREVLSPASFAALQALVSAHEGQPLPSQVATVQLAGLKTTSDHKLQVSLWPTEGSRVNLVSHNWCDPTTWYSDSRRVENETPQRLTDTTYQLLHVNLIDTTHGKIFGEDFLRDDQGQPYGAVVTLGGVVLTETDPDDPQDGDWTLDYATGLLTLLQGLTPEEAVELRVTYRYAAESYWDMKVPAGKVLKLRRVEVQFTADVSFRDTVEFSVWGYAAALAPQEVAAGNLSPTDFVMAGQPVRYKGMRDIFNEANGGYPTATPTTSANPTWRDLNVPVNTFPWDYLATIDLRGDWGFKVRVRLLKDRPFEGTFGTVTFYALSEDA